MGRVREAGGESSILHTSRVVLEKAGCVVVDVWERHYLTMELFCQNLDALDPNKSGDTAPSRLGEILNILNQALVYDGSAGIAT